MKGTRGDLLVRLARANPTAVFLGTLALVLLALFAPGPVGGVILLLLAAGLLYLLATTWPVQPPATRILRLIVLTLLVTGGLVKLTS